MGLGGCYTCIKYLLVGFNVIFSVVGLALLAVGIWVRLDPNINLYLREEDMAHIVAYGFIAVGIIITVVGFFGCCGALRESQCLLVSFFISLALIFISLVGLAVRLFLMKDMVSDVVKSAFQALLDEKVETYSTDRHSMEFMDSIQNELDCCGSSMGAGDYIINIQIPSSCRFQNYQTPCLDKMVTPSLATLIVFIPIICAIPVIVGMVFAMVLCCAIRKQGYSP
ncbi:CD9 antigen-like [Haliotis rubra]|uniref:CD9 antigen-like n=1 Tax=Haliotis rubra TaxID=36100 RepID=UPI001EE5792F|nr:CD9 antigen-like [Haliotis rubra]